MPPTRGHDLKLLLVFLVSAAFGMPPTRGHDLKPVHTKEAMLELRCPPHGGTT